MRRISILLVILLCGRAFAADKPVPQIEHAVVIIKSHKPGLLFVDFSFVDGVGHAAGWGSPQQMAAIAQTDKDIAAVLDAVKDAGLADSTFVILTADHGGAGRTHGPEDPRS